MANNKEQLQKAITGVALWPRPSETAVRYTLRGAESPVTPVQRQFQQQPG